MCIKRPGNSVQRAGSSVCTSVLRGGEQCVYKCTKGGGGEHCVSKARGTAHVQRKGNNAYTKRGEQCAYKEGK